MTYFLFLGAPVYTTNVCVSLDKASSVALNSPLPEKDT